MTPLAASILFSIDLEDHRLPSDRPILANERAHFEALLNRILFQLERCNIRTTFFVVTDLARRYPELIHTLSRRGHEIGWHSKNHQALTTQTPGEFEKDLAETCAWFSRQGLPPIRGFRAPYFSVDASTTWLYEVLQRHGFQYSSSVLQSAHQPFGWPEFGSAPRKISGIWEIPITTVSAIYTRIPLAGGVYFRTLPWALIDYHLRRSLSRGEPVVAYLHPYDFDDSTPHLEFTEAHLSRVAKFFLNWNRPATFERVSKIARPGAPFLLYGDYTAALEQNQLKEQESGS